jgi:hypothetical protein
VEEPTAIVDEAEVENDRKVKALPG